MVHVITVHFGHGDWIELQRRQLDRYLGDYEYWVSLDGFDPGPLDGYQHAYRLDHDGISGNPEMTWNHATKLNWLADRVCEVAADDDFILFLDGDAFPVAPITDLMARPGYLCAVERGEIQGDDFPHPCFCLVGVANWRQLGADWSPVGTAADAAVGRRVDVGTQLAGALETKEGGWRRLHRMNRNELHYLWFGFYGDAASGPVVYHHGAGFRLRTSKLDERPQGLRGSGWRAPWRKAVQLRWDLRQARLHRRVMAMLAREDERELRAFFLGEEPAETLAARA